MNSGQAHHETQAIVKDFARKYGDEYARHILPRAAGAYVKAFTGKNAAGNPSGRPNMLYRRVLRTMRDDFTFLGSLLHWYWYRRQDTHLTDREG